MEHQEHSLFFLVCIITFVSTGTCSNSYMHYYRLSSSKSPSNIFNRTYRRPYFSRNYNAAGYQDQDSVIDKSFANQQPAYAARVDRNSYPREIYGGLISDYFDHGKYQQGPYSWGSPSRNVPQLPLINPRNFFPCPKLEKALHRVKLNFNLAVDDKWSGLSTVDATEFRQDLTTLCNVIRSDFHRTSEKFRKSGKLSCVNDKSFYEAVSATLEDLVAQSQGREWYRRLRLFVGAETFHYIVNDIASKEDN